jgi:hypothetical protein
LPRPGRLCLDEALGNFLAVQACHDPVEQALPHTDEGVALANADIGRITLADACRGQRLV